jgi:NAD(P)-dependent dehydrogenase (short-subunit alcohol dehydrogenase family)
MQSFEGRAVVVTGAGSGIGRAIALTFAEAGARIVAADLDRVSAEQTAADAREHGVASLAVPTDVADLSAVGRLADAAYAAFGTVDILVNNAGVSMRPFRASWDTSYEDFRWLIAVNLWGVIHGHHAFVPRMLRQRGRKHIVNTSSFATLSAVPGLAAYTAAKQAVDGFSLCAAAELRTQGIGLTILYPGYVKTNIGASERLRPAADRSANRSVPPFNRYVEGAEDNTDPAFSGRPRLPADSPAHQGIEPELVGPMVLRAVRENRLFCATHPVPVRQMQAQLDAIAASFGGDTG